MIHASKSSIDDQKKQSSLDDKTKSSSADKPLIIALDAMGGDHAPHAVVAGADLIRKRYSNISFLLYGNQDVVNPVMQQFPQLKAMCELIHTENTILADDKPTVALRQGKDSSMRLAIDAVKEGKAAAMVSSGNTGALMTMGKVVLKTLEGIDRPAIVTTTPTINGKMVMLDLGANIDCTADHLFQFALMGNAFAKVTQGLKSPTIGLLNVGSEDGKGNDRVKAAAAKLRETTLPLNFYGYVEGTDIAEGTVDVIVTDGFTGNISLKTAEGTAKICHALVKEAFTGSFAAKIGYFFAKASLKRAFSRIDGRHYNGAMLVGLNGIIVKSHGGSDAFAFSQAISVAIELATHKINEKIIQEVRLSQETSPVPPTDDSIKIA